LLFLLLSISIERKFMNRLELAIRTFFWIFFNKRFAERIEPYFVEEKKTLVQDETLNVVKAPTAVQATVPPQPVRSEAVQIVSLLQREGRLVDFLKEPIDAYSDAQIGAAVRDIHRDCGSVLQRVFALEPAIDKAEGEKLDVLPGFDPEKYRLSGNVSGKPPYQGTVRHHGWKATQCELPVWRGAEEAKMIVAPAEIEI
jgi:hypothetical protein